MGYDVHITRREHWADDEQPAIAIGEWLALVGNSQEWDVANVAEVSGEQSALVYENEGLAVWLAWSGHEESGSKAWFYFRDGNIVVKNPDKEILAKMLELAELLGARVQGEEGEFFDDSEQLNPVQEKAVLVAPVRSQRPWWKFW